MVSYLCGSNQRHLWFCKLSFCGGTVIIVVCALTEIKQDILSLWDSLGWPSLRKLVERTQVLTCVACVGNIYLACIPYCSICKYITNVLKYLGEIKHFVYYKHSNFSG